MNYIFFKQKKSNGNISDDEFKPSLSKTKNNSPTKGSRKKRPIQVINVFNVSDEGESADEADYETICLKCKKFRKSQLVS